LRSADVCLVFVQSPAHLRALLSFPTRRSSDLRRRARSDALAAIASASSAESTCMSCSSPSTSCTAFIVLASALTVKAVQDVLGRSEEHTSELQSLTNLVCRLLLEKKNASTARP